MDKVHVIWAFQWILYCFVHSFLANNYIKDWFYRHLAISGNVYRLAYNVVAFVYLLILVREHARLNSTILFIPSQLSRVIAIAFILPGVVIMGLCIAKYFKQLSGAFRDETSSQLYTGGLHRFVRHPLYFGTFVFLTGLALYWPLLKNVTVVAIIILYTLVGILMEEKKLLKKFGASYMDYQQNVPMILPRFRMRSKKTILGN